MRLETKKFQNFSTESGCDHLWQEVTHNRFQIKWFDSETFGIVEN